MIDRITARRAALQSQLDHGRLVYADLEEQRDQVLAQIALLQRQLDALAGAIQELDALLNEDAAPPQDGVGALLAAPDTATARS